MYVCVYVCMCLYQCVLRDLYFIWFIIFVVYFDAHIVPHLVSGSFLKLIHQKTTGAFSFLVPATLESATCPNFCLFVSMEECHLKVKICARYILLLTHMVPLPGCLSWQTKKIYPGIYIQYTRTHDTYMPAYVYVHIHICISVYFSFFLDIY